MKCSLSIEAALSVHATKLLVALKVAIGTGSVCVLATRHLGYYSLVVVLSTAIAAESDAPWKPSMKLFASRMDRGSRSSRSAARAGPTQASTRSAATGVAPARAPCLRT